MNEIKMLSENQQEMHSGLGFNHTGWNFHNNTEYRRPVFHHGPFFGNPVFGFGLPFLGGLATGLLIDGLGGPPPYYAYPPYYPYPPFPYGGYYPY